MTEPTIRQTLKRATVLLQAAGIDPPRLDAELLLAHILRRERPWLHAHDDDVLTPEQLVAFDQLLHQRRERIPLAYLIGHKEFFGLDLEVSPAVLIPRPETELLVEKILEEIKPGRPISIVDVGTGSGCIAVAVAVHQPHAQVIASDVSAGALAVARRNAGRHNVAGRIAFVQADLLTPVAGPVDLIVSNPPYVSPTELAAAMPEVSHYEPRLALAGGGPQGLAIICRLLAMIPGRLRPGGSFFIEIGAAQGPAALESARKIIPTAKVRLEQDLAGRDRLLIGGL